MNFLITSFIKQILPIKRGQEPAIRKKLQFSEGECKVDTHWSLVLLLLSGL